MKHLSVTSWVLIALAVSLVLKVMVVLASGHMYEWGSDDRSYIATAQIWLKTGLFTYNDASQPTMFITPGLPAFIAVFMKLIGPGYILEQTLRIVQAICISTSLYLLFLIGKKIFSEKIALWAVIISAFYPPLWLVGNVILTESLFILALMILVYTALQLWEKPSVWWAVLFSLDWTAGVYIRPTIALWPGIFFLLLLLSRRFSWGTLVKYSLLIVGVFVIGMLPWWIRNYTVSGGHFVPLTQSGGNPLLLGSFPFAFPSLEEQHTWWKPGGPIGFNEFCQQWAVKRIKDGFAHHFLLYLEWYTIGKFSAFWGSTFYWTPVARIPSAFVYIYHYLLVFPGFFGIWLARRHKGTMIIITLFAYMTLLHMIYLAHGRYSVPLIPLMSLFTAYSGDRLIRWAAALKARKARMETLP